MSIECSECEWDARSGHDPDCSRSPEGEVKRLTAELERLRIELADSRQANQRLRQLINRMSAHIRAGTEDDES